MTGGRLGRGAAAAGAGALLAVGLALPAGAAASHLSVTRASDGGTVTAGSAVTADDILRMRGQLPPGTSTTSLVVTGPDGAAHQVAQGSAGPLSSGATLAFDLDTACVSWDPKHAPCSGRQPAPNGTWTAALSGGLSETLGFVLRVPPAAPTGLAASRTGRTVTLSWQRGSEPDLRAYDVLDQYGGAVATGLSLTDACDAGGTCSFTFDEAPSTYGTEGFVVRAERATCPSCSELLASPGSTVTVDFGPAPSPTAAPAAGGGSTGTPAASGGPAAASHAPARAEAPPSVVLGTTLNRFLPMPVAVAPPQLPSAETAPMPWGTYKPTLAYGDQTVKVQRPVVAQVGDVVSAVASNGSLWRSLAAALVLVLIAGHLLAWLHRSRPQHH